MSHPDGADGLTPAPTVGGDHDQSSNGWDAPLPTVPTGSGPSAGFTTLAAFFAIHIVLLVSIPAHELGHLLYGVLVQGLDVVIISVGPSSGAVVFARKSAPPNVLDVGRFLAGPLTPIACAVALRALRTRSQNPIARAGIAIAPGIAVGLVGMPLLFDGLLGQPNGDIANAVRAVRPSFNPIPLQELCLVAGAVLSAAGIGLSLASWNSERAGASIPRPDVPRRKFGLQFLVALAGVGGISAGFILIQDGGRLFAALRGWWWFVPFLQLLGAGIIVAITTRSALRRKVSYLSRAARTHAVLLGALALVSWPSSTLRLSHRPQLVQEDTPFTRLASKADESFRSRDYSAAARDFAALVAKDPRQSYLQLHLGISLFHVGKPDDAETPLAAVVSNMVDPQARILAPCAHYWLGRIELLRGNAEAACEHFRMETRDHVLPIPECEDTNAVDLYCR